MMKDFMAFTCTPRGGGNMEKTKKLFSKVPSISVSFMRDGYFEIGDGGFDNTIIVGKYNSNDELRELVNLVAVENTKTGEFEDNFNIMFAGSNYSNEYDVDYDNSLYDKELEIVHNLQLDDPEYVQFLAEQEQIYQDKLQQDLRNAFKSLDFSDDLIDEYLSIFAEDEEDGEDSSN